MSCMDWLSQNLGLSHICVFSIAPGRIGCSALPHGTFGRGYAGFLFLSAAQAKAVALAGGEILPRPVLGMQLHTGL